MEIGTALLLFSSFIILLIKACKTKKSKKSPKKYEKLPSSPPRLPVIGHLHHFLGGGLPHRALARITRKFGPFLHLQLGEISTVVISSLEAAKEVLKLQDPSCSDRPESIASRIMWYDYKNIVFSPYGNYSKQMRKICVVEMLSAKNVKRFGSIRQDEVARLVKSLIPSSGEEEVVNLTKKVSGFTSSMVSRVVFGEVLRDRERLIAIVTNAATMAAGFELADLFPSYKFLHFLSWNKRKLLRMRAKLDAILDLIIEEHELKRSGGGECGGEAMVDVLLRMKENGGLEFPMTNFNIKAILFDMFSGATETSCASVDWAMSELMRNPRVMAKVQAEVRQAFNEKKIVDENYDQNTLKYLKCVIKETLRLHPPAPLLPRACRSECKVDGCSIPLKSKVLVNVWSMGRDPKYWHEPESFQPERFENSSIDFSGSNFELLPFGSGTRMCPGMDFGVANITIALARLLYHFDWKMPEGMSVGVDVDMSERTGLAVSRKHDLFLVPVLYNPST